MDNLELKLKVEKQLLEFIIDELKGSAGNPEMLRALAELYTALKN